jgi:D-tyrosyl-tRNA(Tyr) deacylase
VRLVVQRVRRAVVRVDGDVLGEIGRGAVVLAGIAGQDSVDLVDAMADKLLGLRYFDDREGNTNLALADVGGALLVVSQFTLLADLRRGRRPSFGDAARPEVAEPLVDRLVERLRAAGVRVATGRFGARMSVELENEGPFTLLLDSDELMNTPRRRRKDHGEWSPTPRC